jgi:hypothetical protein
MNTFFQFAEIKPSDCPLSEIAKSMTDKTTNVAELDKPICKEVTFTKGCPIDGSGGHWEDDRGNSDWIPDRDYIPPNSKTNPDGIAWSEILNKYDVESIPFKDGKPDFSEVSKGEVKIDDFTTDRDDNFAQADEKLAEQKGCLPEEVQKWRKENKYTWHECDDCATMQKVPTEIHGNVSHYGGISEAKLKEVER